MARIMTRIWEDAAWRNLSADAQLLGIICMVLGATGNCSTRRIMRVTGKNRTFIERSREELARSEYAHVLLGAQKRRRMPPRLSKSVFDRDGGKCLHCGTTQRLTVDHITPVSRGGSDDMDNLQTLCHSCNSRKGAKVG